MTRVVVIGGGFAGLSAATALADKGVHVTVLEGRQVLGGRAYSFTDPKSGDSIDNGQHLFMGCYQETLKFLSRIDSLDRLTFQDALDIEFLGSGNRRARLHCLQIPAPWHLYSGLLRLKTLSWKDRWRLRYVQKELQKNESAHALDQITVDQWLTRCHQSPSAKRHLWDLITIACLNEEPRIASAATFVAVLKKAFFEDSMSSCAALANVGLSELYVPGTLNFLKGKNAEVRTKSPVQRLEVQDGRVTAVVCRDGERLAADAVISAVPPWALMKMLPEATIESEPYFGRMKELSYSPIISIHLWFDRAIMSGLFAGLLDTHIQWIFNRSRIHRDPKAKTGHVSLVISGAHDFADWTDKKILSMALEELKRLLPKAQDAVLLQSLVIKESQATLSPKVGTESLRPDWQSPTKNLWVAGDWTNTGLPATIESACVSGHRCAELILKQAVATIPSPPVGEGGRRPDEGYDVNAAPLTPTLSRKGRGGIQEASHA